MNFEEWWKKQPQSAKYPALLLVFKEVFHMGWDSAIDAAAKLCEEQDDMIPQEVIADFIRKLK